MRRCSDFAYAMCPDRYICGSLEDAVFAEGSECDEYNQAQESVAERLRAASVKFAQAAADAIRECADQTLLGVESLLAELEVLGDNIT